MKYNPQRPLNSNIARDGAPKNILTDNVPVKPGMVRQTSGDLHPYLHGQALDDSAPDKHFIGKEVTPLMRSRPERGQHTPGEAQALLSEASRLGKPAITDPANGQTYDGARPVTSQD